MGGIFNQLISFFPCCLIWEDFCVQIMEDGVCIQLREMNKKGFYALLVNQQKHLSPKKLTFSTKVVNYGTPGEFYNDWNLAAVMIHSVSLETGHWLVVNILNPIKSGSIKAKACSMVV